MAGIYMSLVLESVRDLDSGAMLVLLGLADIANMKHRGMTWPSVETIGARIGLSERQVREHLRKIEEKQWLARIGVASGGRGRATTYQLNIERMEQSKAHRTRVKGALHCRVSPEKGGAPLPGLGRETRRSSVENPELQRNKGGATPPKRGNSTAPELEVTGNEQEKNSARVQALVSQLTGKPLSNIPRQKPEPEAVTAEREEDRIERLEQEKRRQTALANISR